MSSIIIKYAIEGTTDLAPANFVIPAENSPTAIAVGETATLNFAADGVYFTIMPLAAKVTVENATRVSWTCKTPFTNATLVINNVVDPEADVIVTVPVKVKLAPQQITKPFLLQTVAPIDTRLVLTKKEMREALDTYQPEIYFALCKDDGQFYIYNKANPVNEETGKFIVNTNNNISFNITVDGGVIE